MSDSGIDTTAFHTCPRCGGHDVRDEERGGRLEYECRACALVEEVRGPNPYEKPFSALRTRWRNPHRKQATIAELQARMEETNALFDKTQREKTWPLEDDREPPTSRAQRAEALAWRMGRRTSSGRPAKGYPENEELLAAVLARPDDDEARLAYAAWQRGQGFEGAGVTSDAIAEFIEAQIEIARGRRHDPRFDADAVAARIHHTFTARKLRGGIMVNFGGFDLDVLRGEGLIDHLMFFRGFVEHVAVKAHRFLEIADELFALAPIRHLTITYVKGLNHDDAGVLRALAQSPHLARIRSIELPARMFDNHFTRLNQLTDDDLGVLAASPHLRQLAHLDLEDAEAITPAGVAHLARSMNLPALSFVGLDVHRYFRELGDFGKYASELQERRIEPIVARLRAQGLERTWFDPVRHYGTARPDREAVVEHPVALRGAS